MGRGLGEWCVGQLVDVVSRVVGCWGMVSGVVSGVIIVVASGVDSCSSLPSDQWDD